MANSAVIDLLLQDINDVTVEKVSETSKKSWGKSLTNMPTFTIFEKLSCTGKKVVNNRFQLPKHLIEVENLVMNDTYMHADSISFRQRNIKAWEIVRNKG